MNEEDRIKVLNALSKRGASKACSLCGSMKVYPHGFLTHAIRSDMQELGELEVADQTIPSVLLICEACGAMYQHALAMLGLLP
jgi:hypothetical protein